MTDCDAVRERRFLGRPLAEDETHAATCPGCGPELDALAQVAAALVADVSPTPTPTLAPRVRLAVRPLLATRRRYAARHAIAAAVAAALLPLPLIVCFDVWALAAIHGALTRLLPAGLSLYLVVNYAAVLALLGALTYGAIPLLAERQARVFREASHG